MPEHTLQACIVASTTLLLCCELRSLAVACCFLLPQDFFAFDAGSGFVSPCSEQSGMLVCSQLTELVSSAADFCKAAGGRVFVAAFCCEQHVVRRMCVCDTACSFYNVCINSSLVMAMTSSADDCMKVCHCCSPGCCLLCC